ncbi:MULTISPECIES: OmpA family protein [Methylococcus]|uniref:OmpA family protein n=1 Tax=Methylococcus capsulatus TaxID=414 RepID=A0ABZ2F6H4_METCP|nr:MULTISPECIES: OmpA family protein [Methylococcus]MDF9393066.1 OmpA family protein [Methylococcus capsulatus]
MKHIGLISLFGPLLAACAPTTTVVLVPDDDGKLGQVEVSGGGVSRTIAEPSAYVDVTDEVSEPRRMDDAKVQALFGAALAAAPAKPLSYLLYFSKDSAEPKPDSKAEIPEIARVIKARPLPEVTLIGHSDQVGNFDHNERLSAARAEAIRALLLLEGVDPKVLRLESYGFRAPLFPAASGVEEPRNRRVEVFLR